MSLSRAERFTLAACTLLAMGTYAASVRFPFVYDDVQIIRDNATLHSLAEAIRSYRRAYGKLPESLAQLGPAPKGQISPELASLVSQQLAAGSEGGYHFRYRIVPATQGEDLAFELAAMPDDYGKTGRRSFLFDAAGNVHAADNHGAMATREDPLIPSAP